MQNVSANSVVYPWQQAIWQHLTDYIQQQRLPQAVLLTGPAGIGKRHLADAFSQALMCHAPKSDYAPCGNCQSCKLLAANTHPDFIQVEPEEPGKAIGIDKIRQLIIKLALKPHFDTQRVVIISPAEQLNNASANAFLKCLEEPTERTCLILVTEKPARLPATIRSRCQTLCCAAPDSLIASQWLQQQGFKTDVDVLLSLAQGAPLVAKAYAEQNIMAVRLEYFNAWQHIATGKQNLITLAEEWQKPDKLDISVLLTWMTGWVMDIIKCAHQADSGALHNPDLKKSLQALAKPLELKRLYLFYDNLLSAKAQLSTQVNKQLMLEQLLISWSQLNN